MTTYTMELKKTVVITVDAETDADAIKQAEKEAMDDPFGTWAEAEAVIEILERNE